MKPENFINLTLSELCELTGIAKSSWSLYFNGHRSINERTLNRAAEKLGMSPGVLLEAFNLKRDKVKSLSNNHK